MRSSSYLAVSVRLVFILFASLAFGVPSTLMGADRPRVIVTSDGEIDDECSIVRFLLYANEWDIEAIVTKCVDNLKVHADGIVVDKSAM